MNDLSHGRTDGEHDSAEGPRVRHVQLYETAPKIHPRTIEGPLVRLRRHLRIALLAATALAPWLTWDGNQAILLDIPARQFHVFGLTFFPQDFILVASLLILGAYALFTFTNWLGRVWCGYACPQSVWFTLFIDIEEWIEGPRHRRIRQDEAPMTAAKMSMKARKWAIWIAVSLVTATTFVGYFVPIRELIPAMASFSVSGWTLFWLAFFTTTTLGMGAVLREQVCRYMCPYARFQSAMFDPDTLIVSYDAGRGEPRGPRKKDADVQALGLGACVDCELCVQVCPVGIDIRDGLQYECISCAHCIDACDSVMEHMGYAKGLVSYTTEERLEGRESHMFRPRLVGYALVLVVMLGAFAGLALTRGIGELDVLRDRGALAAEVYDGGRLVIENAYRLRVVNKSQQARTWTVEIDAAMPVEVLGETRIEIDAGAVMEIPLRLRAAPAETFAADVAFRVVEGERVVATEESRFMYRSSRR